MDKFNGSFCLNSSTISDLISISGNSRDSADVSFSKCLLLTPMKPLEADKEQEVVVQISGVKIDIDKSDSVDSFSSNQNTNFNRGTEKFIEIMEKQMAALRSIERADATATGLLFEKIVVDMMDMGIDEIVSTSTAIPEILTAKGWDFQQVAGTWNVASNALPWTTWSSSSIDHLGGKNCYGKILGLLQENYLTGGVRRRRKSQKSLAPNMKFPRIDQCQ